MVPISDYRVKITLQKIEENLISELIKYALFIKFRSKILKKLFICLLSKNYYFQNHFLSGII